MRRMLQHGFFFAQEFHALYNIDQPNASAEDIAFVDRLYARIKECDLQTFPYKF